MEVEEKAAGAKEEMEEEAEALEDEATGLLMGVGWEALREANSAKDDNSHY